MLESDDLFALFLSESRDHLEIAESCLLRLETDPGSSEDIQSCFRALHTIKGSSGFFELTRVQNLADGCETLLDRIRSKVVKTTALSIETLLQTVTLLRNELANLENGVRASAADDRIILDTLTELANERATGMYPIESAQAIAPNILEDFIPEVSELITQAESLLVNSVVSTADIDGALRCLGTLNGICTYLDFPELAQRSAYAEKLLHDDQGQPRTVLDEELHQQLQSALEELRALVIGLARTSKSSPSGTVPALGEILIQQGMPRATIDDVVSRLAPGERLGDKLVSEAKVSRLQVEKAASHQNALRSGAEGYSRVSTRKLEDLVNFVGELVISHAAVLDDPALPSIPRLRVAAERQSRIMRDLQKLALNLRMVPLRSTFNKISRAAHDTAYKLGKKIVFNVQGDDTEIDRTIADGLTDPLLHMIRNAIDHGIEPVEERIRAGKPESSHIQLSATQTGDHVVIVMADDGPGLNPERIRQKALAQGLIAPDSALDAEELFPLIFLPGFSTAERITEISGRGVGMDVVKRNVQSLNGTIDIASDLGQGTRFTIKVPLTTAILETMLVKVGALRFLMPVGSVIEVIQGRGDMAASHLHQARIVESRGKMLPISNLCDLLGVFVDDTDAIGGVLLVIEHFNGRYALEVAEILGQLQVVVKPLSSRIPRHPGLSGSAILPDGQVGLILDPNHLLPTTVNG